MPDTSPELVLEILDMLAVPLAFQTDELPPTDRAALYTEKSHWLRENVLSIILRPHSSKDIIAILTNLPNLRELDIIGTAIRSLRVNADHTGPITSMGPSPWPAVIKLVTALPMIRMLDVTANNFQTFPEMPDLTSPLGLGLVSFRFSSKWVADTSPFMAFLVGGRTDGEALQSYSQPLSVPSANFHRILSNHGRSLRLLAVSGKLKDPHVLGLCTHLERFECETFPSDELVAAIPRTITMLVVTNRTLDSSSQILLPAALRGPPASVAYITQQLDTFPNLQVFIWVGSSAHPRFSALEERCSGLGIELRSRVINSLNDDEIQFSLRRQLLKI
ncbi:hypothetical protein B0H13DRAFT_2660594 [Mycena leptocephala]|nr:hypothetical protein B0H13DRAFT_2660594 [Mycena leptocephala]